MIVLVGWYGRSTGVEGRMGRNADEDEGKEEEDGGSWGLREWFEGNGLGAGELGGCRSSLGRDTSKGNPLPTCPRLSRLPSAMSVTLPAELWDHALSLLSPYDLQPAALALTCALEGSAHVSRALLWRHLVVKKEGGALKAIGMLREAGEGMAQAVRTARIEVWRFVVFVSSTFRVPTAHTLSP